ncbi:hypothetical protein [Roseovarius aestuarii]|uniref:DUF429 domain-containing protein n=1 Tax=Roseovarius aestuarii TaxID=475083 RepID=A0A1X7BWN4_9RHOB|nr:hypothetical protein [Roseovarius aestuarii]SMC13900.1 hypothetical protein ROA7745_03762 [Roseovarius aestuarii]
MTLFLGYDPGGKAKNGVAAIRLNSDAPEIVETATVLDAAEALEWLAIHASNAQALGIDTLLA